MKNQSHKCDDVEVGRMAPNATLTTIDGQPISLADMWHGGNNVLLIFLRHLG